MLQCREQGPLRRLTAHCTWDSIAAAGTSGTCATKAEHAYPGMPVVQPHRVTGSCRPWLSVALSFAKRLADL